MDYSERIYAALFNREDGYARDFFRDVARIADALDRQPEPITAEIIAGPEPLSEDGWLSATLADLNRNVARTANALECIANHTAEQAWTVAFDRGDKRRADRRWIVGQLAHARSRHKDDPNDPYWRALVAENRAKLREFDRES